ncbi:MAG: tRNA dihydrouridine synthase DusB [Syntrophomonadaceae bacterium]|nr:tRNA dihydrouridine synthase DusB [Syntrophomonadaceae bacterium]
MFYIKDIPIGNRVLAAPLAGVGDKAYRIMARTFGCGLAYSEMISDKGLLYNQVKTRALADVSGEGTTAVQIFGAEIEDMVKAAAIVEKMGAEIIDINMGCPTPKIVRNGEGAALMRDIGKSRAMIREVVKAVKVPVTVKMRKGWDENSNTCLALALAAQEAGAKAVTIHPRFRSQFFSGHADWEAIKEVKEHLDIPVIGNGDIWKAEDALHMIEYTNCDAVMIGRAAMGNPFIFRETVELLENGRRIPPATVRERIDAALKHLQLVSQFKGEAVASREMRKHLAWYTKGLPGAARIREEINLAKTPDELLNILNKLM